MDIWRIRNPKTKQYTFRLKHVSGSLQSCLDYFLMSNKIRARYNAKEERKKTKEASEKNLKAT